MRTTIAVLICLLLAMMLLAGCGTESTTAPTESQSVATEEPVATISPDVLKLVQSSLESACLDADVLCYQKDGKAIVSVRIDPLVMNYLFAYNLEPAVIKLRAMIDEYAFELGEFDFSGVTYKDGEVYNIIRWQSADLSTGEFVNPMGGYVNDNMTLQDVFDYCEYTAGEYKNR